MVTPDDIGKHCLIKSVRNKWENYGYSICSIRGECVTLSLYPNSPKHDTLDVNIETVIAIERY